MPSDPRTLFHQGTATEVQELMTTDLVSVRRTDTVRDALTQLIREHVNAVAVTNGAGEFAGIVTAADLIRTVLDTEAVLDSDYPHYDDCLWAVDLIQERLGTDPVTRVMSDVLVTVRPETSMHHAACIMLNHHVHHLPVVDHHGKLVGMLSASDFLRLTAGIRPGRDETDS